MGRVTSFFRSAVAAFTRVLNPSANLSDDSLPEYDDLLRRNEQLVEQLNMLETQERERRYAERGVFNHPFKEAERWLKELLQIVTHELERQPNGPLHYDQCYDPEDLENKMLYGESRPVRMPNGPQKIWLTVGAERSPRGYRPVRIIDGPLPTHAAIFAALTALQAETISEEDLDVVLPLAESDQPEFHPILLDLLENEGMERAVDAYASARFPSDFAYAKIKFAYAKSLLRYYRPNFDDLPDEERQALIKRTCQLINENRASLRRLLAFAEYGTPGKKMVNPLENVGRDVQAAVLADVEKLSHAEVGEELGIARTENDVVHGGHARVSKMVKRGRSILEKAWGKEGWQEQVLQLQAERDRWMHLERTAPEAPPPIFRVAERLEGTKPSQTELALPIEWAELRQDHSEWLLSLLRSARQRVVIGASDARLAESQLVDLRERIIRLFAEHDIDCENLQVLQELDQDIEASTKYVELFNQWLTNPFSLLAETRRRKEAKDSQE